MPVYSYRCDRCGDLYEPYLTPDGVQKQSYDAGFRVCHVAECAGTYRRKFSFSFPSDPIGDGYYDHSVGAYVTSKQQLDDINKVNSEAATLRTGVEHNFVAQDINDLRPPDLDD